MPEVVNCPSCNRMLQVADDVLGQQVQCPNCAATFVASTGSSVPPPPFLIPPESSAYSTAPSPERYGAGKRRQHYDDDDYEDYEDRRELLRRRYTLAPHRGSSVLALGIIALVMCGPILGPMAWKWGNTDLEAMRAGRMDPTGEGLTNAGRICGIVATIYSLVVFGLFCLVFAFRA